VKKILLFVLVVILSISIAATLSVTGCKKEAIPAVEEVEEEAAPAEEAVEEEVAPAEIVEINYLTWRTGVEGYDTALVSAFEAKYPNIKVNFIGVQGVEEYVQTQKTRLLTEVNLDITSIREETIKDYVGAGYLADITGESFLGNLKEGTLERITVDGKVYGIPSSINLIGVWYNKELFEKVGVSIPKNWGEFLSVCDKFKSEGYTVLANGSLDVWPTQFDIYPYIHKLIVEDPKIFEKIKSGEVKYTDPIFVDAFKSIDEFYKKGYVSKDVLSIGYADSAMLFINQEVPMVLHGEWFGSAIVNALGDSEPNFTIGVFPMPTPDIDEPVIPLTVGVYEAVVENSPHKAEAMKFLEFLASVEGSQIIADYMKGFTPVIGVKVSHPLAKLFEPLMEYPIANFFYSEQTPAANAEFNKGLQDLVVGKITPEQLAERVQKAQEGVE